MATMDLLDKVGMQGLASETNLTKTRNYILNYKLIEKIGEGAMGEVYKAYDLEYDRHVALKIFSKLHYHSDEQHKRRLTRTRHHLDISHPNICQTYSIETSATGEVFWSWPIMRNQPWQTHSAGPFGAS
ncbi:MAG: hypothetical protein R2865_16140 [Deinococcales bacterium]